MGFNKKALSKATANLDARKAQSKPRDIIYDPMGQWKHPGQPTRIPGGNITMRDVPYPVMAYPSVGQPQMMYPEQDYNFPNADYVDEYPQMRRGGVKKFSRDITATNILFTKNPYLKKKKSKKKKIFDPNAQYFQYGGGPKLIYSPYSVNEFSALSPNPGYNPSQSIALTIPHLLSKSKSNVPRNPLQLTLGRPYDVSDEALTNPAYNFVSPGLGKLSYKDYAIGYGDDLGDEPYIEVANALGKDPSKLTEEDFNKYAAQQALNKITPKYTKPGKPIDVNVRYNLQGFGQKDNPNLRGGLAFNAGYNPLAGFYGGLEGGAYGILGNVDANRYLKKGLTDAGDVVFTPSLSASAAIRQRQGYPIAKEHIDEFKNLLKEDIEQGTEKGSAYYNKNLQEDVKNLVFGVRPELKAEYRPFKKLPVNLEGVIGANIDFLGDYFGEEAGTFKPTFSPYGKVSAVIPLNEVGRKVSKIQLPQLNMPEREEKQEKETRQQKPCPEGYTRYSELGPCEPLTRAHHPRWLKKGGDFSDDINKRRQVLRDWTYGESIGMLQEQDGGSFKTQLSPEEELGFQKFYQTLPDNLREDDPSYDIRGYWDAEGRPEGFNYDQPKESDGYYHAYSINPNTGEYLKSPWHETFQHAVDEDRRIGWRPVTNVQGRNIAIENESIASPEEQSFLRNTEGPINDYIETELTPEEIEVYRQGGYIVEEMDDFQKGGTYYTVPGSKSIYRKVNGKWQVDWNKSGNFQPITKGNVSQRIANIEKNKTQYFDKDYGDLVSSKSAKYQAAPKPQASKPTAAQTKAQQNFDKNFKVTDKTNYEKVEDKIQMAQEEFIDWAKENNRSYSKKDLDEIADIEWSRAGVGAQKQPDEIKAAPEYSTAGRAWEYATNPFTAFEYSVSGGGAENMPHNINAMRMAGVDPGVVAGRNVVGNVLNMFNLADAGDKVVRNAEAGNYGTAALEALRFVPGARVNTGAGKFLTTKTPLKNAYKINPFAFKPDADAYYRMVNTPEAAGLTSGSVDKGGYFNKGVPLDVKSAKAAPPGSTRSYHGYEGPYMIVHKGDNMESFLEFPDPELSFFKNSKDLPLSNQTKVYKEHWLKGYKEVPTSLRGSSNATLGANNSFKSEIDWRNWVKYKEDFDNNPDVIQHLYDIEKANKEAGTWMKNADGSPFQGTPEEFVVQQSDNFKNAFPNYYGEILTHQSPNVFDEFDESMFGATDQGYFGKGVYTYPAKKVYDPSNEWDQLGSRYGSNMYDLYVNSSNKGIAEGDVLTGSFLYNKDPKTHLDDYLRHEKRIKDSEKFKNNEAYRNRRQASLSREYAKTMETIKAAERANINQYTTLDIPKASEVVIPFSNRVKSAKGNILFDMTNPNIYKGIAPYVIPATIGLGAASAEYQKGGSIDLELTPEEIAWYKSQGYEVEELD